MSTFPTLDKAIENVAATDCPDRESHLKWLQETIDRICEAGVLPEAQRQAYRQKLSVLLSPA